jgi:uncharacterized OB-fold protein
VPDEQSERFWAAAVAHTLTVARCSRCQAFTHPPDVTCPNCGSTEPDFVFVPMSGSGTVRSWIIMNESFVPGFEDDIPFVLVDVELVEQPELRLIGRLLDGPDAALRVGMAVRAEFEELGPGVAVPAFVLATDS